MIMILTGLISIYGLKKAGVSDGFIIAFSILMVGLSIADKLWDIKIRLTEIRDTIKNDFKGK